MARLPLLNVRLPKATIDAVAMLAAKDGKTTSALVRELIELAVAAGGLGPFRRTSVELRLQRAGLERDVASLAQFDPPPCAHPTPAHMHEPFLVRCSLCGAVVRRTG